MFRNITGATASRTQSQRPSEDQGHAKKAKVISGSMGASFVDKCERQQSCDHVKLSPGQYIADVADRRVASAPQKAKVPVNIRVDRGVDANELDYNRPFASEEELARYVVEKTPVYGFHESMQKRDGLKALERGEFARILSSRGVRYDLV